ncbi:hypothetical protein FHS61_002826 [Altererythrobacter atlanticus]|jgi:hypothetical protein|uniref:Uncharacterized protein n=1 Tax=Croceibacterium atlanticum TaxID=1267766 RepID=A0A0F7KTN3_9SPHN|nr:hypothetical protein [Croceibacterium atlanticum]AKH43768.1 hypothetical protein WYH_02738 [Croceibacterium atlanticum]MBB5733783.1 hypothetical protein [Croceibacterium atlanticum]|tara:strand:+ start:6210 stop:6503 length:294 start_codon:yes stop_codon:yes gene_type:complete
MIDQKEAELSDKPFLETVPRKLPWILAALLAIALLVWFIGPFGQEEEKEVTYVPGAKDISGGELIVTEPDPLAVPVELPKTPMTPVPPEKAEAASEQ